MDPYLNQLVTHVEKYNSEVAVTVMVDGTVITGLLVPAKVFLTEADNMFVPELRAAGVDLPEDFGFFNWPGEIPDDQVFNYLHITNAQVFGPTGVSNVGGGFSIRVKASSVSGWMMGRLNRPA